MPPAIITLEQLIPCTERDLSGYEDNVRNLLPNIMRQPLNVDCLAAAAVTLSGVQTIDTVAGVAGQTTVLVTAQADVRENGPYTMQSGAWTRITAQSQLTGQPWQPSSPDAGFRSTYYICGGSRVGQYWWLISPDPIKYGVTPLWYELLGDSPFAWHLQLAEQEIAQDLDRPEKPLRLPYLADRTQLRQAKVYKLFEILFRQAAANSADGMPDRHERLSKLYMGKYEREMSTTTLRTIDQARVRGHGRTKRVVRG